MTEILGYKIFNRTKAELLNFIFESKDKINIISGNPEVLYNGLKDNALYENFNSSNSVIIPDGVGVVYTSKLLKQPVKEKIAGIEVMEEIIKHCEKSGKGIYLLGAEQSVLESCRNNLQQKYPNLKITGIHNGFFDLNNCEDLITEINAGSPFALFVAMGAPRQDKFIIKYMNTLDVRIFMGVGGSFDVFGGKVNRAPKWMIKCNIEWLYRVAKEPWRIKRLGAIPKFMYIALKHHYKKNNSK